MLNEIIDEPSRFLTINNLGRVVFWDHERSPNGRVFAFLLDKMNGLLLKLDLWLFLEVFLLLLLLRPVIKL